MRKTADPSVGRALRSAVLRLAGAPAVLYHPHHRRESVSQSQAISGGKKLAEGHLAEGRGMRNAAAVSNIAITINKAGR